MQSLKKIWKNRNEIDMSLATQKAIACNIPVELSAILMKRNLSVEDSINDNYNIDNGELLSGATEGIDIIINSIRNGEVIYVINDYDVDGITSGEIIRSTINILGGNCEVVTPDRHIDGYGLPDRLVDIAFRIIQNLLSLLIMEYLLLMKYFIKSLGMKVIVTDHHEVPFIENEDKSKNYIIPQADVVINPHLPYCIIRLRNL